MGREWGMREPLPKMALVQDRSETPPEMGWAQRRKDSMVRCAVSERRFGREKEREASKDTSATRKVTATTSHTPGIGMVKAATKTILATGKERLTPPKPGADERRAAPQNGLGMGEDRATPDHATKNAKQKMHQPWMRREEP